MDGNIIQSLERLFCDKILIYNDLLDCFYRERDSLINVDLDELWKISKDKEALCSKITSIRQEIIASIKPDLAQRPFNLNDIMAFIPDEFNPGFQKLYLKLVKLKSEIDALRKENMVFIDDSLEFMDEMISVISGGRRAKVQYNERCQMNKSGHNMILSREA